MKNIMLVTTLLITLMSQSANARTPNWPEFKLPKDATSLRAIDQSAASMQIKHKVPANCPINAICEPYSVAVLTFVLNGCMDRLGPVVVDQKRNKKGEIELSVTAFNINVGSSSSVMCMAIPTAQKRIPLGLGFYGKNSVKLIMNKAQTL